MDSNASNFGFASKIKNIDDRTMHRKNDASIGPDLDANNDNENNNNTTDRISGIDEVGSVPSANVVIRLAAVEEIIHRFQNTLYFYFIGKRLVFPLVENYVKNGCAKFGLERVMLTNGFFFFQFANCEGMETCS
nr:hypothetical protein [Tanacetum cinerariifolium]